MLPTSNCDGTVETNRRVCDRAFGPDVVMDGRNVLVAARTINHRLYDARGKRDHWQVFNLRAEWFIVVAFLEGGHRFVIRLVSGRIGRNPPLAPKVRRWACCG